MMGDMLLRSTYADLESEREVVLEEIAMYEDEPQDKVHDVLSTAVFGDHPLGRPVIGRGRGDLVADRRRRSRPTTTPATCRARSSSRRPATSSTSRSSSWRERWRQTRRATATLQAPQGAPPRREPRAAFHRRRPSSTTSASAAPGIPRDDERRFALSMLDAILGGSTSSRLFQEVREKRGLAYSIYSWASQYRDTGQVGIYVGTREDNVGEAIERDRLRARRGSSDEAVGDDELRRAREHVKGRARALDGVDRRAACTGSAARC